MELNNVDSLWIDFLVGLICFEVLVGLEFVGVIGLVLIKCIVLVFSDFGVSFLILFFILIIVIFELFFKILFFFELLLFDCCDNCLWRSFVILCLMLFEILRFRVNIGLIFWSGEWIVVGKNLLFFFGVNIWSVEVILFLNVLCKYVLFIGLFLVVEFDFLL